VQKVENNFTTSVTSCAWRTLGSLKAVSVWQTISKADGWLSKDFARQTFPAVFRQKSVEKNYPLQGRIASRRLHVIYKVSNISARVRAGKMILRWQVNSAWITFSAEWHFETSCIFWPVIDQILTHFFTFIATIEETVSDRHVVTIER
jgi:hypothetical protein